MDYSGLCAAALDATASVVPLFASGRPERVRLKGDRDVVTDLDVRIQADITEYLSAATPGIGVLGEEHTGGEPGKADAEWLWVLDPIDGTSNFVHGLPFCAISLALVHRGEPVVGVIRAPLLDRTYHAVRGGGAWLNGRPIVAASAAALGGSLVSLGDYAVGAGAAVENRWRMALTADLAARVERIRMFGSAALDLAFVAEGATDGCVIVGNKSWDVAAGVVIAREAGAVVTDRVGRAFTIDSGSTVAAAPGISDELVAVCCSAAVSQ